MINISLQQLDYMKHALGNNIKKTYRNYFCAGVEDSKVWDDLVKKGLAIKRIEDKNFYPDPIYHVTDKGINLLKEILK